MLQSQFMPDQFHICVLYDCPLVNIRDVRCRPSSAECSLEEESDTDALVMIRRGAFVRHAARKETFADCQKVLFFKSKEPYRVHHPVEGGDDCTSLRFAPEILDEAFGKSAWPRQGETSFTNQNWLRLQHMRGQLKTGLADAVVIEEMAMGLLAALADSSPPQRPVALACGLATKRAHGALVRQTQVLLGQRYRDRLSLTIIARQVHSSPYHLARIFSREAGCSIHRYLLRLRLNEGLERVLECPDDLTAVALDMGFSSHSHFSDAFRREFGKSPSTVRAWFGKPALRKISKILKA